MKKTCLKTTAIIVAGGTGSRMGTEIPKQFLEVLGKPVISYTLNAFSKCDEITDIIIVTLPEYLVYCKDIVDAFGFKKVRTIVPGGCNRCESVRNGLKEVNDDCEIIAVHDGVRPMIEPKIISNAIVSASEYGCAAVGVKMKDTIKVADDNGFISHTADRETLWQIQTPQVFKKDIIKSLYENFTNDGVAATDDCYLAEQAGYKIKIVDGSYENIKVTTPQDIYIMKGLLGG